VSTLRVFLVVVATLACGMVPAVAQGDDVDARLAFRIDDDRVTESSGLTVSRTHPGLAYTVNDSGDDARVLTVSMRTGAVVGETRLSGVEAVDVEALAPAPGGRLDIGDNGADRESVELYVIAEPGPGDADVEPRRVSLSYPGGPRDAEALVVAGRRVYVVTKNFLGGQVFTAPVFGSRHDAYGLRQVASAPSVVTDAARLADGEVVMRDYDRGYVVDLPRWRVRRSYALPRVEQGETMAAAPHGRRVYVGSEGSPSPVFVLRVPEAAQRGQQQPQRTGAAGAAGDQQTQPAQAQNQGEQDGDDDGLDRPRARPPGYIIAVAAALVIGLLVRRYRRRHRGRRPPP
jgi:hypothetical protein